MTEVMSDEVAKIFPELTAHAVKVTAMRLVTRFVGEYGGANIYIPKDDSIRTLLRDLEVWAEYDGTKNGPRGISALARKHGTSDNNIWAILRKQRAMSRNGEPSE